MHRASLERLRAPERWDELKQTHKVHDDRKGTQEPTKRASDNQMWNNSSKKMECYTGTDEEVGEKRQACHAEEFQIIYVGSSPSTRWGVTPQS